MSIIDYTANVSFSYKNTCIPRRHYPFLILSNQTKQANITSQWSNYSGAVFSVN